MPEPKWSTMSFIIGIFVGLLIMLVMCWISFSSRTFIFEGCISKDIQCKNVDYYNNPSEAIKVEGVSANDILKINDNKLYYQRVPKTHCRPSANQTIHIFHPQQCQFTIQSGDTTERVIGKNGYYESPYYIAETLSGSEVSILTSEDCKPIRSNGYNVVSGIPLENWDV